MKVTKSDKAFCKIANFCQSPPSKDCMIFGWDKVSEKYDKTDWVQTFLGHPVVQVAPLLLYIITPQYPVKTHDPGVLLG